MLQFIRDRAQGLIAWFIVFLIVVPFAMWGINDYVTGGKEKPVANVNGTAISKPQLQNAYQQQRQRLEQMLGPNFKADMFAEGPMKQAVLDQLVERELVAQAVRDAGLRVSDRSIADLIRSVGAFQDKDGKFSQAAYEQALRRQGLTPEGFEAEVRRDMASEQWTMALQASAFATPAEAEQLARLLKQTRDFGYLLYPVAKSAAQVQVSDAEAQSYYDKNKARFVEPEKIRVAYIELSSAQMAAEIAVSDEDVTTFYQAHRDEFAEPESRRASHILFRVDPGAAPAVEEAARKQAEDALKRIRAGENFAALAKKLSQDPGSASKGGDLGFFGRGMMDKAFEEKVFSLRKGDVSDVVRSAFGYHIIRLEDVRGGGVKPIEQVRDQIRAKLRADKAQERFYSLTEKLNNLVYEHPESLQAAADELKLSIKHSDYFARAGGTGLAANPKFTQAAFSEEVLERGNNSEAIEIAPDHLVALRLEDRRPEAQLPLNTVRPQIVSEVRNEKAKSAARDAAEKALAAIKSGADVASVAKSSGGTWQVQKAIGRNEAKVPRPIVESAFHLPRPSKTPSAERVTLQTGDEAVVVLQAVQEIATTAAPEPMQAQLVMRADAESGMQGALATLRKQGKVEINKDQL